MKTIHMNAVMALTGCLLLPTAGMAQTELTKGWISEVISKEGIVISRYYDPDAEWNPVDGALTLPSETPATDLAIRRTSKLIVSDDGEYSFKVSIMPPVLGDFAEQFGWTGTYLKGAKEVDFSDCAIQVKIGDKIVADQTMEVNNADLSSRVDPAEKPAAANQNNFLAAMGKANVRRLDTNSVVETTPETLAKGVYDVSVLTDCRNQEQETAAARQTVARMQSAEKGDVGYRFAFSPTNDDEKTTFAVKTEDLANVHGAPGAKALRIGSAPVVPDGYESGWLLSAFPQQPTTPQFQGWGKPNIEPTFEWVAPTVPKFMIADPAFMELSTIYEAHKSSLAIGGEAMFTASESGEHVFAFDLTQPQANIGSDAGAEDHVYFHTVPILFRVEDQPPQKNVITNTRANSQDEKADVYGFGEVSEPASFAVELEKGKTYRIAFLTTTGETFCQQPDIYHRDERVGSRYCLKHYDSWRKINATAIEKNAGSIEFRVKTPSDPGLRLPKDHEILHKSADAQQG
ncbi:MULTISPECIES: hypothetical protein [unclassified Pannonibacter]|uniref:hypothetical protein n=1 Tax=unclassified Pannonibacter TaxID=2627228 RepID=UPI0016466FF1|nr:MULTISPECIES: hypothetical protein [unclassified Pannonibacter]